MDEVREQLPARTTPTWEMELLVSGATIFGLLQLPELLDHGYFRAVNLMPQDYADLLMPLWLYTKIAVVTLILTFLAHLCLRAYWVALVGMNSVYPGGIRWDKLGLGPIARARLAAQAPAEHIAEAIERADNRATRVFGVGVSFAMLMVAPVVLVLVALAIALLVQALLGEGQSVDVLGVAVAVILLPWMLAMVADRRLGTWLAKLPVAGRVVGAVADFYARFGFGPRSNPLVALFASHAGRVRFALTALLVIMPVSLVLAFSVRGRLPFGMFAGLNGKDTFSASASPSAFYADQRGNPWMIQPLPRVPSRVVEGPYLELFVPFIPRLHAAQLGRSCPQLATSSGTGDRARLDCLARIVDIRLDGTEVAIPLEATTDAQTGQQGMLAMIPVGALAPGRHELSLLEPDRRGGEPRRYRIPFWK
jgi:hypothetical protein